MKDLPRFAAPATTTVIWLAIAFISVELLCFATLCFAQPSSRKSPQHRGQSSHLAPDTTGSLQTRSSGKSSDAATASEETLPFPYTLPAASRSRVRECGDKWQMIKLSGTAGEMIWRDFASGCLAAKTGPFDTHAR